MEKINRLLVEYYEGNTTEEQEELLKDYFKTADVPDHLQKEKEVFLSLCSDVDEAIEVPVRLEKTLSLLIDEKAKEEQLFFHRNRTRYNWYWVGSIAATLLLLVSVGYGVTSFGEDYEAPQDTFSDPVAAYQVLQATLIEVSANLNEGVNEVQKTQQDLWKVTQEVRLEIQKK